MAEIKFPKTLQELVSNSVKEHENRPSFSFVNGHPITYKEWGEKINDTKKMLAECGVKKNDKVAILSHNMPNWSVAYFAITTMGAVAVPLLPDFSAIEVDNILKHSEAKVAFVSQRLQAKLDESDSQFLKTKINIDEFKIYANSNPEKCEITDIKINPEDLAVIIYTSGTTGQSKGVMLTHKNICVQLEQTYACQNICENDVFLSILPLSHTYENSCGLILGTFGGAATYYLEKPATASILLPALKKIKPTAILTVPLIIEKIYRDKVLKKIKSNAITKFLHGFALTRKLLYRKACNQLYDAFGGRLVFFGIGGAKLDPIVERFLYEGKKIPYAIGYGLTECAPLVSAAVGKNVRIESAGFPIKNLEMKINNPNPTTGEGEVWVRGDNIMKGYYKSPEMTKKVLTSDGWFRTGDLGLMTKSGRLFLRGRLKNMILSASGENIYPEEIESIINNYDNVLESMVVERKGKLMAIVRFNYDDLEKKYAQFKENLSIVIDKMSNDLIDYVNMRVSKFSRIAVVIPLPEEFEKTASQKIKRYLYTESFLKQYIN